MNAPKNLSTEYVQSLARGLKVIKAFSANTPEMTLSEVAVSTGLTRASTRRFLLTLQDLGYVSSSGRRFTLTPRVLELGYAYLSSSNLWDVAEPYLEEVTVITQESSSLSVLDGTEIVYVARVPTRRVMSISLNVGARLPAYCTSMGRVLLAELEPDSLEDVLKKSELDSITPRTETDPSQLRNILRQVKRNGYSIVNQELELGLRSVAVGVYDKRGQILAALNIGAPVQRVSMKMLEKDFLPTLKKASKKITQMYSAH